MKITIDQDYDQEIEEKGEALIKAIASAGRFEVEVNKIGKRRANEPRPAYFKAQKQILEKWDKEFKSVLTDIKAQIDEIIKEK